MHSAIFTASAVAIAARGPFSASSISSLPSSPPIRVQAIDYQRDDGTTTTTTTNRYRRRSPTTEKASSTGSVTPHQSPMPSRGRKRKQHPSMNSGGNDVLPSKTSFLQLPKGKNETSASRVEVRVRFAIRIELSKGGSSFYFSPFRLFPETNKAR